MAWPSTKFTKSTLLTLAGSLCLDEDNSTTISQYYNDVIDKLGKQPVPVFLERGFQRVTSGTATYDNNDIVDGAGGSLSTLIRILYLFLDDTMLLRESPALVESYSESWEADSGTPVVFITEDETQDDVDRHIRLYPSPDTTGDATGAIDWGANFPDNDLAYIFSEDRSTDIEDYFALPIIFDILALEFAYPSDHQDLNYAAICAALAEFMYRLAGVQ